MGVNYSGTPLNGHPSTADTCDITDVSECPDCMSIDFNTFKTPCSSITGKDYKRDMVNNHPLSKGHLAI